MKNKNKKAKNCRVASTRASSSGGIKLETNIEIDNSLAASEGRFQSAVKDATTRLLV